MKKMYFMLFFVTSLFLCLDIVEADSVYKAYVVPPTGYNLAVNKEAKAGEVVGSIPPKTILTLDDISTYGETGCRGSWYKVSYEGITGYACGTYLNIYESTINTDLVKEPENDYERYLASLGFPASYFAKLTELHNLHPTWVFNPTITNLDFELVVAQESVVGQSFTNSKDQGYYSTDGGSYSYLEDKFYVQEGGAWYAANEKLVAYYMDPRNSLTEARIFQFEELKYESDYITADTIRGVLGGNFSYIGEYADDFVNAGREIKVNSVYLAALARQELGGGSSVAISGAQFCYPENNSKYPNERNKCYTGYYNFFNIGAGKDKAPVYNSLIYAKNNNWNTPLLALTGGARSIANNYIFAGQSTSYTKRFNVAPDAVSNVFAHQYQTNVMAAYSESSMQYYGYKDSGNLELPLTFSIPVYTNMPSETTLPTSGNPNNHLNNIKVNGTTITNFAHDTYNYTYYIADTIPSVTIEATAINSNATITGTGVIGISESNTPVSIIVTAQNGNVQEYKINLVKSSSVILSPFEIVSSISIKSDGKVLYGFNLGSNIGDFTNMVNKVSPTAVITYTKNDGSPKDNNILCTGDKINIANNDQTNGYEVIIYGDPNGDGEINIIDLLKVQKHLLGYGTLENGYKTAADIDRDGDITIVDLLKIQKYLLGYIAIEQ